VVARWRCDPKRDHLRAITRRTVNAPCSRVSSEAIEARARGSSRARSTLKRNAGDAKGVLARASAWHESGKQAESRGEARGVLPPRSAAAELLGRDSGGATFVCVGTRAGSGEAPMRSAKATRVRRKLRVARGRWTSWGPRSVVRTNTTTRSASADMITPSPAGKLADVVFSIAAACSGAIVGFDLCARRTRDETIAVAARCAAAFLRALLDATVEAAWFHGIEVRPRPRTGERMRWEWLASTATVVDGSTERRLLAECARILTEVDASAADALGDAIAARLRVASAEAYSLAAAAEQARERRLAFAFSAGGYARVRALS
jgi:hypothetical protein